MDASNLRNVFIPQPLPNPVRPLFPFVQMTHYLSRIIVTARIHSLRTGCRVRTRKGLGISSCSGSQTGGSPPTRSAIRAAKARPFDSGLRFPSDISDIGRPPALACASSTKVRPFGAKFTELSVLVAMLFLTANLLRSTPSAFFFVRLVLRCGEVGALSWERRFVDDGIFDSRRLGELLRSRRAAWLDCGRRSGAFDRVGIVGAVFVLPAANIAACDACF
jgi:hypothetical protein